MRGAPPRPVRPRHPFPALRLLAACLALAGAAAGQPYAAGGGFDRPREVVSSQDRPALALVVDRGRAYAVRLDRGRVLRLPLGADGSAEGGVVELAGGSAFWDVLAAGSHDGSADAVYAWFHRDFGTGRYVYEWHVAGETRSLLEAPQAVELRLAVGPDGPEAWLASSVPDGARVERIRWRDGPEAEFVEVLASELGIRGLDVAYDETGSRHVAFLEGFTEATDFGVRAEWSARYLPHGDEGRGATTLLGPAAGPPDATVVAAAVPLVAWTDDAGRVVAAAPGGDAASLGGGRPAAATAERIFWVDGATIAAAPLPLGSGGRANVAWSPLAVDAAAAVRDAAGVTHLAWLGRRVGGGYALFASDDARPMERTLRDRVAAAFGWTPWAATEEGLGQAAGALLVGVGATMALVPLLWLLAALLVRRVPHERARIAGALLAVGVVGLAVVALRLGAGTAAGDLAGLPWVAPLALALGALVGVRGLARADLESLQTIVLASCVTAFVSITSIAFVTFQRWLAYLGI